MVSGETTSFNVNIQAAKPHHVPETDGSRCDIHLSTRYQQKCTQKNKQSGPRNAS